MLKKQFLIFLLSFFVLANADTPQSQLGKEVSLSGNTEQLKYFFEALAKTGNSKVRIAHYGDSIILGDIITEYLRSYYQKKFGGSGLGFINVYSRTNLMKKSIIHNFSSDWKGANILHNKSGKNRPGISGHISICGKRSWFSIKNSKMIKLNEKYSKVSFFYKGSGKAQVFINGKLRKVINLSNRWLVNKVSVKEQNIRKFKVTFENFENNLIYGVSLENGNGIYIDNFPISGDSGTSLLNLDKQIIAQFRNYFNYKLIILNYGVNVFTPNNSVFRIYEKKMLKVIKYLKKEFPETSILLVSAGDKTVKRNGRFVTDKNIPKLIRTQKKIAEKSGIAFWNMAKAMGGKNSMNKWVSNAPPLALKDYLHFTHKGGERIAELLIKSLKKEYDKYIRKL